MKRLALLVLTAGLAQGCGHDNPLATAGAIVTAPITAPILLFEARRNDRDAFLEQARRNDAPLPPMDTRSRRRAQAALEEALERAAVGEHRQWRNDRDANGRAGGEVTVLADVRADDGRPCREVLIATMTPRGMLDQRVRTWCLDATGWKAAARATASGTSL